MKIKTKIAISVISLAILIAVSACLLLYFGNKDKPQTDNTNSEEKEEQRELEEIEKKVQEQFDEIYNDPEISPEDKSEMKELLKIPGIFSTKDLLDREEEAFLPVIDSYSDVAYVVSSLYNEAQQNGDFYLDDNLYAPFYIKDNSLFISSHSYDQDPLSKPVNQKFLDDYAEIEKSFRKVGYYFDYISIKDNIMFFNTTNGDYDVMYSMDGISPRKKGFSKDDIFTYHIKHIENNWYHRTRAY